MKIANPLSSIKTSKQDKTQLTAMNALVLKEILRTEITPTPADVRLEHWRFKKLRVLDQTS